MSVQSATRRARTRAGRHTARQSCVWEFTGEQRSAYEYVGNANDLFQQWQNCEITTDEFQEDTARGDGTAALRGPGLDRDTGEQTGDQDIGIDFLTISPQFPTRLGTATVTVRFINRGDASGSATFDLLVNHQIVQEVQVDGLEGGQTVTRDIEVDVPDEQRLRVEIGGSNFSRETHDFLEGRGLSVTPDPPIFGQEATFRVTLENTANQTVTRQFEFVHNGQTIRSESVTFNPGQRRNLSLTVTPERRTQSVRIGPATFDVEAESGGNGDSGDTQPDPEPDPDPDPDPEPDPSPDPGTGDGDGTDDGGTDDGSIQPSPEPEPQPQPVPDFSDVDNTTLAIGGGVLFFVFLLLAISG